MKEITLNGSRLLLVEVPGVGVRSDSIWVNKIGALRYVQHEHEHKTGASFPSSQSSKAITLPPGNWQLLFADPLKPTEEEAAGVVEPLFSKEDINRDGRYHYEFDLEPMPYKNYLWGKGDGSQWSSCSNPVDSWNSLVTSHGFTPGRVVGMIDRG